jgi:polar amino acid transport system permease protein
MRHVVLPQAFKRVLPPLAGQFISLVKDTSLVSVIAITELLKSGREVITTSFSPFEILFCVAGLYLLINLPLSKIASRHGVPALQPVPAHDRAGKPLPGAESRAQAWQE